MTRRLCILALVVATISDCASYGSNWVPVTPLYNSGQSCSADPTIGLAVVEPAINSLGVGTAAQSVEVTNTYTPTTPQLWFRSLPLRITAMNGTSTDFPAALTNNDPIKAYWLGSLPQLSARTYYAVYYIAFSGSQSPTPLIIGCFTTN